MKHEFKLENLKEMKGGLLAEAFNQLVERCAADCDDRPAHNKPRTVTMTVAFKPVQAGRDLDTVEGVVTLACSLPKVELPKTSFAFRKKRGANGRQNASLVFDDLSEDDVHQRTIDDATGE